MLEGIDRIEWSSYRHAFGPAGNVPQLLAEVGVGGQQGADAVAELFNTIWHQGTIYSATEPTVPFLGALVKADDLDLETRQAVLHLIYAIGRGKGFLEVHVNSPSLHRLDAEEIAARLAEERSWVQGSRRAVEREADLLLAELSALPRELWLRAAVLTVVAGATGRSLAYGIAAEAVHRLPEFGATALAVLADLTMRRSATADQARLLRELDVEIDDFMEHEGPQGLDLSVDSHFVDLIVDRTCDTNGAGSPTRSSP